MNRSCAIPFSPAIGVSIRRSWSSARLAGLAVFLTVFAVAGVANAGVNFVCDSSIGSALCAQINGTVDPLYNSTFSNANSSIYLTFGNTELGASDQYITSTTYSAYVNALTSETNTGSGVVRLEALNSLPASEPLLYRSSPVVLTSSLAAALGLPTGFGNDASFEPCALGTSGCYNGLITLATPSVLAGEGNSYYERVGTELSTQFDIFGLIEHETDELLGTSSCVADVDSTAKDACGSQDPTAADLYRFSAPGVRSLVTTNPAYFSYDDGTTDVANYNTALNRGDFGDWSLQYTCAQNYIQDAFACAGSTGDITNSGGPEVKLLNAVGFNLVTGVPEPSAWTFLLVGVGVVGATLRASRRKGVAASVG